MSNPSPAINDVESARCLSVTTWKRDDTPVATPIWFNVIDGKVVFTTPRTSGKVKRVRNNPKVTFARCTQRGKVVGPVFEGTARVLPDDALAAVLAVKKRRYPATRVILRFPANRDQVAIEVTPNG